MIAKSKNWLVLLFGIIVACSYGGYCTVGATEFVDNKLFIHHHRLPTNVIPVKYEIVLDTTENFSSGYSGNVTIDVKFYGPPRENGALKLFNKLVAKCLGGPEECPSVPAGGPNKIVMHADKLVRIKSVEVIDKASGEQMEIVYTGRDTGQQMIMVRLAKDLPTDGRLGQIKVHFSAPIRDKKGGVYSSKMLVNGETFTHLLAKFQPVFARLALPCFDEPHLKATFRLRLRHDRQLTAYANTERERVKWIVSGGDGGPSTLPSRNVESVFKETPVMSIHMVAFVVGEFDSNPLVEQVRPNLRLRFLSPPGLASRGQFALETAKETILQFEEDLDGEHLFPMEKLDIVTTGELDTDNLETWGLVFIRNYLVEMDADSQPFTQVNKALTVAHVVIHQWFANLVTARWWNDLWITESIAAEQAYYLVEKLYPEFDIDYFARLGLLKDTLDMDRPGLMHPLSPPANDLSTPEKINQLFDELTFMKSASLARMVRNMGSDEYNKGLKCLIARHSFKNINAFNLVECFKTTIHGPALPPEAASSPSSSECTAESRSDFVCMRHLSQVYHTARSFGHYSGYPIVNVDLDEEGGRLIVYLESSSLAKRELDFGQINKANFKTTARANAWYVPLWVMVTEKGKRHDSWLRLDYDDANVASVELPDWFDPKEGGYVKVAPAADISTYYRVRYSDRLLDLLKTPIQERELDPMHRLHILEDARGLLRANLITKEAFIKIMDWYKDEDNLAVIFLNYIALVQLYRIQSGGYSLMTIPQVSSAVFQNMFAKHKFRASGDETPIEELVRKRALCIMIIDGNQDVIDEAVETYEEVGGDVDKLPLFLRVPVYMGVAVDGTEKRVKELLKRLEETNSLEEQMRLIEGLSRSKHTDVLKQMSEFLLKRSSIRSADLAGHFKTFKI